MRVEITLDSEEMQKLLENIETKAKDMSDAMQAIAFLGEQQMEDSFQTETAPDGTAWTPSWRKQEQGGKTLTKDGNLRRSASSEFDGESVQWGVGMMYGAIHQFGGTISAKNGGKLKFSTPDGGFAMVDSVTIPARPFLPTDMSELDIDAIMDIFKQHLLG